MRWRRKYNIVLEKVLAVKRWKPKQRKKELLKWARPSPDHLGTMPVLQENVLYELSFWPTVSLIAMFLAAFSVTFPDTHAVG